jgi:hypothetical protein
MFVVLNSSKDYGKVSWCKLCQKSKININVLISLNKHYTGAWVAQFLQRLATGG